MYIAEERNSAEGDSYRILSEIWFIRSSKIKSRGCDKSLVAAPFFRINGAQKLASAVISPTKRKIGGVIFVWLFLLLDAGQLFHNLFFRK
ncbi:TPA: hypothetical protein QFL11_000457 [Enterococcus faecium]|nr:hypothetical protein [Enterococcus faecium]EME8269925.1 hypothetical protein [Enterococcus faecium]